MTDISGKLADKNFHNWLKTGLALHLTKQGLETLVDQEMQAFQADCLKQILTPAQMQNNDYCSKCRTENVVRCPTKGVCVIRGGNCSFHNSPENSPKPCPKQICEQFRSLIVKCHKNNFPSWRNTYTERWCNSPWEIAKCYMPPDGYSRANSAAETDLNGILSVMLNFKPVAQQVIERNCTEAREVSRKFRHSANLGVTDKEMSEHIDTLIAFLTCTPFLSGNHGVIASVQKMKKLKVDALTISTHDVTKVLKNVIEDLTRTSLRNIDQKQMEILQETSKAVGNLQSTTSKGIDDILSAKVVTLGEVSVAKRAAVEEIRTETKRLKNETSTGIDKLKSDSVDAIKKATKECISEVKLQSTAAIPQEREDDYARLKQSLCEDLIAFYEDEYSTVSISPLVPEQGAHLLHFFVQPSMEIAQWTIARKNKVIPIYSYQDIFMSNTTVCRNIYITAQAGMGKTTFAKRLCMIWCYAKRGHDIGGHDILESDINMLKYFDYLFFIPLRNCHGKECKVEEMIKSQVIDHLSWSVRYQGCFLERLLHEEKTLVILEGLDEWSHPQHSDCNRAALVPHRIMRQHCSILTTTRPWKMYEARISNSKVDKYIKMVQLVKSSQEKLIHNVVNNLTGEDNNDESVNAFLGELHTKDINDLGSTPVLLIQLICLWIDGRTLSSSKCSIYFSIVDYLLHVGVERVRRLSKTEVLSYINRTLDDHYKPTHLHKYELCKSFSNFLIVVGELAFKGLFFERKESSLVIKSTVVEKLLTENELWCCLHMGILTRNKRVRVSENLYTYSFIHKTFQEFFAAFYIQAFMGMSHVTDTVFKVCNSLSTIIEMSHVFVFLCGLRHDAMRTFSERICEVVSRDSFTRHFRSTVLFVNSERVESQTLLKDYQNMCIDCTKEFKCEDVQMNIEDFFFDQDSSHNEYCRVLTKLLETNRGRVMSVTLEDLNLELLHKIMENFHLTNTSILGRMFMLSEMSGNDFVRILSESVKTLRHLSICSRSCEHGRMVAKFTPFSDIHLKTFQKMSNLESLVLECFTMTHSVLVNFLGWVTQMVNIKQLGLLLKCEDHGAGCPGVTLDLSKHTRLESLELCALRVTDIIINTESLLDSHIGSLAEGTLADILDSITKAKKLRAIEFYDITTESSVEKFLNTLTLLDYLEVIELNRVELGQRELVLSKAMKNLKGIMLVDVCISCAALRKMIERVEDFSNSVRVMMWHCNVTPHEDFAKVKDVIRTSNTHRVIQDWRESDCVFMFTFTTLKYNNPYCM